MKLAEALIERADLQREIAQLESRMRQNAKVQEGDEPAEDVSKLLPQYERKMADLEGLIIRINKTNHEASFDAVTLADAIAKRDCLKSKLRAYRDLHEAASISQDRYSNKEIKFIRCIDVAILQDRIDRLAKEYRELDTKLQAMNWAVDLLD